MSWFRREEEDPLLDQVTEILLFPFEIFEAWEESESRKQPKQSKIIDIQEKYKQVIERKEAIKEAIKQKMVEHKLDMEEKVFNYFADMISSDEFNEKTVKVISKIQELKPSLGLKNERELTPAPQKEKHLEKELTL